MNVILETDECYPGNSGDHKTSIMSIPDECYSRNGYPGNSGDHNTSIMSIPDECYSSGETFQ